MLKQVNPDYKKKIVCINGDATKPGLGMNVADRELITKEVNFRIEKNLQNIH